MSSPQSTVKPTGLTRPPHLKRPPAWWDFPIPDSLVPFPAPGVKDTRPIRMDSDFWGRLLVRRIQRAPDGCLVVLGDCFTGDVFKGGEQLPCLLVVKDHVVKRYAVAVQHRQAVKRARMRIPQWLGEDTLLIIRNLLASYASQYDTNALWALAEEIVAGARSPSGQRKRTEGERWLARQLEELRPGDPEPAA